MLIQSIWIKPVIRATIDPTVWWVDSRLEAASVTDFPYTLDTNRRYTSTIVVRNKGINFYPYLDTTDTCYIDTSGIDENNAIVGTSGTFYGSDVKGSIFKYN